MEGYEEDISENLFFITLKYKYPSLFELLEKKSLLLCVPQSGSISGNEIAKSILETHILSPTNDGLRFTTLNGKLVLFQGKYLYARKENGFQDDRDAKVYFEELYYGSTNTPFRILCLDRLLEGEEKITGSGAIILNNKSLRECQEFLGSFPENSTTMAQIDLSISKLVLLPSIKNRAWSEVKNNVETIFHFAIRELVKYNTLFSSLQSNKTQFNKIKQYIECYILGAIHIEVFCEITMAFAEDDNYLVAAMEKFQYLTLGSLGVQQIFQLDDSFLLEPVDYFSTLDDYQTPIEKLFCIKDTINLILKVVEKHLRLLNIKRDDMPVISTDDLLPLLIYVIIKSHPMHVYSNVFYINNFQINKITSNSDIGFNFSTFQAAVEFLRTVKIEELIQDEKGENLINYASYLTDGPEFRYSFDGMESKKEEEEDLGLEVVDQNQTKKDQKIQRRLSIFTLRKKRLSQKSIEKSPKSPEVIKPPESIENQFLRVIEENDLLTLQELLQPTNQERAIKDVNLRNEQGFCGIHRAALNGFVEIAELLLSSGADPNKKTRHGATALHLSSQYNKTELVALLLRQPNIEVNAMDLNGNTPLHMACSNGHIEAATLLLNAKANFLIKNQRGETPLHNAAKWGSEAIGKILVEEGKSSGRGTGLNDANLKGETPIFLTNNEALADFFLANGADLKILNQEGLTPLHRVCQTGNIKLCELFLKNGANPNAFDIGGRTSLHSVACTGNVSIATLLIEKGRGNVNAKSRNGNTPLHASAANGHLSLTKYFLKIGADYSIRNKNGQVPYQLCGKNDEMKKIFDSFGAS